MSKKKLSTQYLNSNIPAGRYYDDSGTGLHIYVRKSGSKSWSQKIRFGGKMRVKYWPDRQSLEQSISRGRKKLKIDSNWNSKVCEKILHNLMQTTGG